MRVLSLCLLLLAACATEVRGFDPPLNDLYFPSGLLVHPNGHIVYVVNANTDLRYNSSMLSVIDLDLVTPSDAFNRNAIRADKTKRIQSYGATPSLNAAADKLFVPTRENNLLYVFDIKDDGGTIDCGTPPKNARFSSCDSAHTFAISGKAFNPPRTAENLGLTDADTAEVWSSVVTPPLPGLPGEFLYLTHMGAGVVTTYDVSPNALFNPNGFAAVTLLGADVLGDVINGTDAITLVGANNKRPLIYVGSAKLLSVKGGTSAAGTIFYFEPKMALGLPSVSGAVRLADALGGSTRLTDIKDMVSNPEGTRLYAVTRDPSALLTMDTAFSEDGVPRNRIIGSVAVERAPSALAYVDGKNTGGRDLIYVSCFGDASVLIFDAETRTRVGKIYVPTQGPFTMATSYRPATEGQAAKTYVLVTYFNDDALAVIDASALDPSLHSVYARIGSRRADKVSQ